MRAIVAGAGLLLSCFAASASPANPMPQMSPGSFVQHAQACGFYAILGCFGTRGEAQRWTNQISDGYVVNTSSGRYPNFRAGYFCVVNGPGPYGVAQRIAAGWRRYIPDAYVKNAC